MYHSYVDGAIIFCFVSGAGKVAVVAIQVCFVLSRRNNGVVRICVLDPNFYLAGFVLVVWGFGESRDHTIYRSTYIVFRAFRPCRCLGL